MFVGIPSLSTSRYEYSLVASFMCFDALRAVVYRRDDGRYIVAGVDYRANQLKMGPHFAGPIGSGSSLEYVGRTLKTIQGALGLARKVSYYDSCPEPQRETLKW